MKNDITILIQVLNADNNVLLQADAETWESAEEQLGKLQRAFEKKQAEAEERAKDYEENGDAPY